MSRGLRILLATVLAVLAGSTLTIFHLQNHRLRERIADLCRRMEPVDQLRKENARLHELLSRNRRDEAGAGPAIHAELVQAQDEIVRLEQRAAERFARRAARTEAEVQFLQTNRDPTQGLTRLDHFQDVGQGTPSTALQTAVWATLQADGGKLAKLLTLSDPARTRAEAIIANLPEGMRTDWTPDKIAALAITGLFSEVPAMQVVSETLADPQHASVAIYIPGKPHPAKISLQLGSSGWQIVVGEGQISRLQKKIEAESEAPPEK